MDKDWKKYLEEAWQEMPLSPEECSEQSLVFGEVWYKEANGNETEVQN